MTALPDFDFKLLRLILIDSYSPGGEVIIDLDNGAILTGDNGAGKTSILSLIPIFYGENPGRCTTGTDSFSNFYLPNSTSYVVFEYSRRGVTYLSVLYAVGDGSFNYRFIRSAYDISLFTEDGDGRTLVPAQDLKLRLQIANASHSPVLTLSEYRNVIQGRVVSAKSANESRRLIAEYAFAPSNSKLIHIEKIVSGMFSRKANFDEFLRVIVDYISDDGDSDIIISGNKDRFSDWPTQYAAYNEVMSFAGVMAEVNDIDAKLQANHVELCCLHAKFLRFSQSTSVHLSDCQTKKNTLSDSLSAKEIEYTHAHLDLTGKASAAFTDASSASLRIEAIRNKENQYALAGMEEKSLEVESIPRLKTDIQSLEMRKEVLLGDAQDIENKYQSMVIDAKNVRLSMNEGFDNRNSVLRSAFSEQEAALRTKHDQDVQTIRIGSQTKIADVRLELGILTEQVGELKAVVSNPPASDESLRSLDSSQDSLRLLREEHKQAEISGRAINERVGHARDAYVAQHGNVHQLKLRIQEANEAHQGLLAHLNPDPDSLLHFLRANHPEWTQDIAKVIKDDILTSKSLSPSIEQDAGTLYGLSLDLTLLDGSLASDEAALQVKLAENRKLHDSLIGDLEKAEAALELANQEREKADAAMNLHQATIANLKARESTLLLEEAAAKQAVQLSKAKAKKDAQDRQRVVDEDIKRINDRIAKLEQSSDAEIKACGQRLNDGLKAANDALKAGLDVVKTEIQSADSRLQNLVATLEREKALALSEKGVDAKEISHLDHEIAGLQNNVRLAEGHIEAVQGWKLWKENEFPQLASFIEAFRLASEAQAFYKNELEQLSSTWKVFHDRQKVEIDKLVTEIGQSEGVINSIQVKTQSLADFPPDRATLSMTTDATWSVGSLSAQEIALLSSRKSLRDDLKSRISRIKNAFIGARGSHVTEQYFNMMSSAIDPNDSDPSVFIKPFRNWFEREHETTRDMLLLQAKEYGSQVSGFYTRLVDFHKAVSRFNADIQQALNATSVFRRISNVTIRFDSTLKKLMYWDDVENFIQVKQAWDASNQVLPPDNYGECLRRLVSHWQVKEGLRAERRKLINIEGEVVENGTQKTFRTTADLDRLSSNGLSYLILCIIFVAFVRKIRGDANVLITWSVDEILDLDPQNISDLLAMLRKNGITLVSACPPAEVDILVQFEHRYRVERQGRYPEILECEIDMGDIDV